MRRICENTLSSEPLVETSPRIRDQLRAWCLEQRLDGMTHAQIAAWCGEWCEQHLRLLAMPLGAYNALYAYHYAVLAGHFARMTVSYACLLSGPDDD